MENKVSKNAPFRQLSEQSRARCKQAGNRAAQIMVHSYQCQDENCSIPLCRSTKRVIKHFNRCQWIGDCSICKAFITICRYQAKLYQAQAGSCSVPSCLNIKVRLRQNQVQNHVNEVQLLREFAAQVRSASALQSSSQEGRGELTQGFVTPSAIRGPQTPNVGATPSVIRVPQTPNVVATPSLIRGPQTPNVVAQFRGSGLEPGTSETPSPNVLHTVQDVEVIQLDSIPENQDAVTSPCELEEVQVLPPPVKKMKPNVQSEMKQLTVPSVSEAKKNKKTVLLEVNENCHDILKCPVCLEYFSAPILQCSAGHSICSVCKSKVQQCPLCFQPYLTIRNFTLEQMIEAMKLPCKYSNNGCDVTLFLNSNDEHEKTCPYRL